MRNRWGIVRCDGRFWSNFLRWFGGKWCRHWCWRTAGAGWCRVRRCEDGEVDYCCAAEEDRGRRREENEFAPFGQFDFVVVWRGGVFVCG